MVKIPSATTKITCKMSSICHIKSNLTPEFASQFQTVRDSKLKVAFRFLLQNIAKLCERCYRQHASYEYCITRSYSRHKTSFHISIIKVHYKTKIKPTKICLSEMGILQLINSKYRLTTIYKRI